MDDEGLPAAVDRRLKRVEALGRSGAAPGELLAELRGLLREAERARSTGEDREEVVERLRTVPHGT